MAGKISRIWAAVALALGLQMALANVVFAQADTSTTTTSSGGYSSSFVINGAVTHPTTFTLKTLQALRPTSENVYYYTGAGPVNATWTGVLLWDLLQQVGIKIDATIKNDILGRIVVVTGTDGYQVTTSVGELAPQFGGNQVLVAYAENGTLLGPSSGFAGLVFPGDKAGGRAVYWIKSITVY